MEFSQIVNYFINLFVVCSPLSALPALMNLSRGRSLAEKKSIARTASIAVAVILVIVTWVGGPILSFFGIKVPAFQLAGGFVLLLVAFSMLNAQTSRIKQTTEDEEAAAQKESIAVVPLAMPIMAGPGAITTVIVGVSSHPDPLSQFYMSLCAVLVALTTGSVLYFASPIERVLGQTGINIVTRIGGLILASLSVQAIATGAHGLYLQFLT